MKSVQAHFLCKHCSSRIATTESRSLPQTQRCTSTYANRQGSVRSSVSGSLTRSHADSADTIQDQFSMPAAMCLTIAVKLAVYAHKIILRSSEMIEPICLDNSRQVQSALGKLCMYSSIRNFFMPMRQPGTHRGAWSLLS